MINVVIVEDEQVAFQQVNGYLDQYARETGEQFRVIHYFDVLTMLDEYKPNIDIVFMDIELPHMNGLEGCRKLRELDESVTIIFITNMAQYAVNGYEVNAFDFVVKPVTYPEFAMKLRRTLQKIALQEGASIGFTTKDGIQKLPVSRIAYIESIRHLIVIHTDDECFETYGTLKGIEEKLPGDRFIRCNSGFLVNLRYVERVQGYTVYVKGCGLPISRAKKKDFMEALNNYLMRVF